MIEPEELDEHEPGEENPLALISRGARHERRRRRRLRKRAGLALFAVAVAALGGWALERAAGGGGGETVTASGLGGPIEGTQVTYLVTTKLADDLSEQADTVALFALDAKGGKPVVLFVPASIQAEVPGHGFDSVGRALSFGGVALHTLTVENLLGADIDHTITVRDDIIGRLVDTSGGIDVEVPERLLTPDAQNRLVPAFEAGRQHLNGDQVRAYLAYLGSDETELSRPARARQVWDALLAKWKDLPAARLTQRFAGFGAGFSTDAPLADAARFFTALAATQAPARLYATVPTTPVGAGGDEQALRIDDDALRSLMRQYFAASLRVKQGEPTRVEILNGNGVPQIGEKVSRILVPAGFRLVLDRNAERFDHATTKIIVYSRDDAALAVARRIRELLKVGEIEIALQGQTLVDVTVVVGKDFVARSG